LYPAGILARNGIEEVTPVSRGLNSTSTTLKLALMGCHPAPQSAAVSVSTSCTRQPPR
jgi:hypothetical protein